MDPPEHTRVRRYALAALTRRRVERMRPQVERIVTGLLDAMAEQGAPADLVEQFALPLPVTVICELLGVPVADRERFAAWSDATLSVSAYSAEQMADAYACLRAYLTDLIEQRRTAPSDDLLSALVHVRDAEGGLSEDELLSLSTTLLVAGYETTASQLTNATYTLLHRRRLWERLVAEPGLLPAAI